MSTFDQLLDLLNPLFQSLVKAYSCSSVEERFKKSTYENKNQPDYGGNELKDSSWMFFDEFNEYGTKQGENFIHCFPTWNKEPKNQKAKAKRYQRPQNVKDGSCYGHENVKDDSCRGHEQVRTSSEDS